jgi:hypothetical protein
MDLCYFKAKNGNFGDDLNPYILNHFIPNFESYSNDIVIFLIGTVLHDDFVGIRNIQNFEKKQKIVLGAGVRYINMPIKIDKTWTVRFLRGPLSSLSLKNNTTTFITDPAYLIRELPFFKNKTSDKKYKTSLMPHIFSLNKVDWKRLCKIYGVNFIDPSGNNIDFILNEINQSEFLITEAMHGAIVADALRVPWKRFKYSSYINESEMVSEFKWSDWLFSMNLKHDINSLYYNKLIREIDRRVSFDLIKNIRTNSISESFERLIKKNEYQLSTNELLNEKNEKLTNEILWLKNKVL